MTRGKLLIGTFVAAFAAGVMPASAQNGKAGATEREPGTSAERTGGSAVSRGDAGSSSGSSSSVGSSSSGPSSSSGSSGRWEAPSSPSARSSGGEYYSAPSHPSERQQSRQRGEGGDRQPSGSSSSSGSRAVPRGSSDSGGSGSTSSAPSRGASASASDDSSPSRRAVPTYSRPRDGRQVTGTAVERQFPRIDGNGGYYSTYPYYYGSTSGRYYWPGYGFGLGYYYDPLWYDPFYYGGGYGYGGYSGGGIGYYGQGSSGRSGYARGATGSLRLKIKPRNAQVYVDGYFVGDVDSFDGIFQRLGIDAGSHRIEIRAEGHEPIQFEVLIAPGETVTYKGELRSIR